GRGGRDRADLPSRLCGAGVPLEVRSGARDRAADAVRPPHPPGDPRQGHPPRWFPRPSRGRDPQLREGGHGMITAPRKRTLSLLLVAVALGAGIWGYLYAQDRGSAPMYRLERAERGPLVAAVSATGNLNAVTAVQVGTQVSGQIKELYADFNSVVRQGQVVARIDPATFEAKVRQARADVD